MEAAYVEVVERTLTRKNQTNPVKAKNRIYFYSRRSLLLRKQFATPNSLTAPMQVNSAILAVVQQISHVLQQLEPHEYRRQLPEFEGSTLGQHFRHILEFFQCLEKGISSGMIDYAARERNLLYEDNPGIALSAFETFAEALPSLGLSENVEVRAEFGGAERPCYPSTVGRELMFVYDHAIHHLAIIKIGLRCHFPEVQSDKDLGVSPSTIKAREKMGH